MIFFFAISLGWIAFSAGSVIAGASKRRDPAPEPGGGHRRHADGAGDADLQRGSDAHHRRAAGDGRGARGASTRTAASRSWCSPTRPTPMRGFARPRRSTGCAARSRSIMPVWYRRRWRNVARKSGNLEDFVTRWGGRYDHMIVLDADSLIDAPTLTQLVQMMHADPGAGHPANRAATDRRTHLFWPPAAIRRLRLRPGHHARACRLVGRQRQLLGPQCHHPRAAAFAQMLRTARTRGPQALWRPRAVA